MCVGWGGGGCCWLVDGVGVENKKIKKKKNKTQKKKKKTWK